MPEQSEQAAAAGDQADEKGRIDHIVWGSLIGLLCFVGVCVWAWSCTVPLVHARDLAAGRLDEVPGVLVECDTSSGWRRSGAGELLSGMGYCLSDPEQPLEEASITVGWPDYRQLRPAIDEQVVGLVDEDRVLMGFRLADGEVVAGSDVGWRSVWEGFFAGLAAFWSALKLWRAVYGSPGVGRGRSVDHLAWTLGFAGLVLLGAHARMPLVALAFDALLLVGLGAIRWRDGRQGLRDFLADREGDLL